MNTDHKLTIFARIIFLAYTFLVLGLTIFFRTKRQEPLAIVWKGWTFHREQGRIDLNPLLNILMLIPFTFFLFAGFRKLSKKSSGIAVIGKAALLSFCFSLFIELMQIVTRLGTFQVSDLTYNTLSGVIGSAIFLALRSVRQMRYQ